MKNAELKKQLAQMRKDRKEKEEKKKLEVEIQKEKRKQNTFWGAIDSLNEMINGK